jgi:hypothetical protein
MHATCSVYLIFCHVIIVIRFEWTANYGDPHYAVLSIPPPLLPLCPNILSMQFYATAYHYPLMSRYSHYTVLSNPLSLLSFMSKYFSNTHRLFPDFMSILMSAYSDSSVYFNHLVFRCESGREMILSWMVESIFGILYLQNTRERKTRTQSIPGINLKFPCRFSRTVNSFSFLFFFVFG